MMGRVAYYFAVQSGRRLNLEWKVFDWVELNITDATWEGYGGDAGSSILPEVTKKIGDDLGIYDHVLLVIDKADSFSARRSGRYTHFGAQSLTPAIVAHELGHFYGSGHANLESATGPVEYGDAFCVMGAEGGKYSFDDTDLQGVGAPTPPISHGPGMVAPNLEACTWIDLHDPQVSNDLSKTLLDHGEAIADLYPLRGSPPVDWQGPSVVATMDLPTKGQRIVIEYRIHEDWDRALPAVPSGGRGWVVIHLATGIGRGTTSLSLAAIPATLGSTVYIPRARFRITVATLDPEKEQLTLRVDRDRLFVFWKGAGEDQRLFFNSTADGGNFTEQRVVRGAGGTSEGPAAAALHGRLYTIWKGSTTDPRLFYSISADGLDYLDQMLLPGAGGTSHSPAAAASSNRLYVAWKGAGEDSRLFFNSSPDGTTFDEQKTIPGTGGTSHGPALATSTSRLYVAWKGASTDERLFYCSTGDGVTFSDQKVIPGTGGSSHAPAMAVLRDRLYVAWKGAGSDNRLFYNSSADGLTFTDQKVIPGTGGTDDSPSLASFNNRLFVAWKGANGDQRLFANSSADGTNFSEQQIIPGTGGSNHRPTIAMLPDP